MSPSRAKGIGVGSAEVTACTAQEQVEGCSRSEASAGELWYRAAIAIVALSLVATSVWI